MDLFGTPSISDKNSAPTTIVSLQSDILPRVLSFLNNEDTNNAIVVNRLFYGSISNNWSEMQRTPMKVSVKLEDTWAHIRFCAWQHYGIMEKYVCMDINPTYLICRTGQFPNFLLSAFTREKNSEIDRQHNVIQIRSAMEGVVKVLTPLLKRAHLHQFKRGNDVKLQFMLEFLRTHYNGPKEDVSLHMSLTSQTEFSSIHFEIAEELETIKYLVECENAKELTLLTLPKVKRAIYLKDFKWTAEKIIDFVKDWQYGIREFGLVRSYITRSKLIIEDWQRICDVLGAETNEYLYELTDIMIVIGQYFDLSRTKDGNILRVSLDYHSDVICFKDLEWFRLNSDIIEFPMYNINTELMKMFS